MTPIPFYWHDILPKYNHATTNIPGHVTGNEKKMIRKRELTTQLQTRLSVQEIRKQTANTWKPAIAGIFYLLALIGFIMLIARLRGEPIWKITGDPAEIMHYPAYIGALSSLGNLLWSMTAAVCLLGAIVVKQHRASRITRHFFLTSGMFSIILCVDDLFLLHDHVIPALLHIPEMLLYLLYLIAILVYLTYFMPCILNYEYLLLGTSIVFFGLSRSILAASPFIDHIEIAADILKHFGIVFWLIFFYRTVLHEVNLLIRGSNINPEQ